MSLLTLLFFRCIKNLAALKLIVTILILLMCGLILYYFVNKTPHNKSIAKSDDSSADTSVTVQNPFEGLRNMAFSISPSEIGINAHDKEVYGVIMDWNINDGIMTLVSYQNGDASIYLSSGGGFMGGGKKENISNAAKIFVKKAQTFIGRATLIDNKLLPDTGCVRFYLLTTKGISSSQMIQKKDIEDSSSPWFPLFIEANNVISEFHNNSPK